MKKEEYTEKRIENYIIDNTILTLCVFVKKDFCKLNYFFKLQFLKYVNRDEMLQFRWNVLQTPIFYLNQKLKQHLWLRL